MMSEDTKNREFYGDKEMDQEKFIKFIDKYYAKL